MDRPSDPTITPPATAPAWRAIVTSRPAQRDFLVGAVIVLAYVVLLLTHATEYVFPFLQPLERKSPFADELLIGVVLVAVLGFTWAVRRGREMASAARELEQTRQVAEVGFERNPLPMAVIDLDTLRFLAVNDATVRQYGWSREEFLTTLSPLSLSPPHLRDAAAERLEAIRGGASYSAAVQHWRKDGSVLWVEITQRGFAFDGHRASVGAMADVTARVEAEGRRRAAEQRFEAVFSNAAAGIVEVDASSGRIMNANQRFADLVGRSREALAGVSVPDITYPDDLPSTRSFLNVLSSGHRPVDSLVKRYVRPDGSLVWAVVAAANVPATGGLPPRNIAVALDLTTLRHAEQQQELLAERLHLALDATGEGLWDWDLTTDECYFSPALNRMLGFGPEGIAPQISSWKLRIHPEDLTKVDLTLKAHLGGESSSYETEHRLLRRDGTFLWVLDRGRVVKRDELNRPLRMVGTLTDISVRRDLEEQLRQAQKMEAVGQLAGGIAHDFNNLLTVMRTGLELALSENLSEETRADLREVEMAAERAATLTSQLLAFSRRRQTQRRLISLNDAVDDLTRLLNRVLSEDIEVRRRLESRALVLADPGHIGQALLNIALNARDAMPEGGVLSIATFDTVIDEHGPETHDGVDAGAYSVLTISDTGSGMTPEVRAHLFEPFFTTKPVGKGTGLGLASVYGMIKQANGMVRVESAVGAGSKFLLYFPVAIEASAGIGPEETLTSPNGHELVMVAEDDPAVRAVAARTLMAHGYRVRQAADGAQGAALLDAEPGFALVLADVVMPVMSGSALAALVRERHPDTAIVMMSAHSHEVLAHFPLPEGTKMLNKPFTAASLLQAVREAIDHKKI